MDAFIGTIIMWPSLTLIPKNWAVCNGALLSCEANTALHAVLGNQYGGDGVKTFALPDLSGRVPLGVGNGDAFSNRTLGQKDGEMEVTLTTAQLPWHNHEARVKGLAFDIQEAGLYVSASPSTLSNPADKENVLAAGACDQLDSAGDNINIFNYGPAVSTTTLSGAISIKAQGDIAVVQPAGGNVPHNNMQPTMGICYLICTSGLFPLRNL